MKKVLLFIFVLTISLVLTGCFGKKSSNVKLSPIEDDLSSDTYDNDSTSQTDDLKLYSDDSKLVFEYTNTKYVFYYSGDKVTGYYTYVDYETKENAKIIYNALNRSDYDAVVDISLNGRYIVFRWDKSEYEDMSVEDIKAAYSYMKELTK